MPLRREAGRHQLFCQKKAETKETTMNDFDKKAQAWDKDPEHVRRSRAISEAIGAELPSDSSINAMEYGCGTGLLSFFLRQRFSKLTLVDSSEGMLSVLKEKIENEGVKNMEPMNVDLLQSPEAHLGPFSVIYSAMALHHIPDVNKLFEVWHAMLSTPGYLCIADIDTEEGFFHGPEFTGHKGFNRGELEQIVVGAGFVDVRFRTVYEMEKTGNDGISRKYTVFLMSCGKG
jgi:ubiquinone/menaquinone biosynthesis C-methylase UbiE